jgi:gliding motility-associated-like protein
MYRGELLFFLLAVGIFSIDFFKVRTGSFFDSSTLPPKITQWELNSCTRTISVQAVAGGIPPYDFYVFKQDSLDLSNWQMYRLIKEQLPQISSLPPGTYRIKAVNEGVTSPSFATNTLEVNFPADPEIEVKGTTSLCSGSSTAIALHLADSKVLVPIRWTAQVLLAPEGGELLGYTSNPLTSLLEITDTLINTGRTLAKVSYQLQALINGCLLPARTVEVQVNPVPRIEATVSDSLICSGTPFSISLLPKSWGASPMQLRRTATLLSGQVIGLEQGNPSPQAVLSSITQTLVNRGTGPARIRYTFYPSFNGCDGVAEIVEVVLLPEPQVTQQADLISCAGEWVSVPEFNSNLPSDSLAYSWEVSDPSLGLSSGTGNRIPDFQAINSSPGFKRALVRVTPMLYSQGISCPGSPFSFSITVRPPLVVKEELSNYSGFGVSCAGAADGKIKLDLSGGILSDEEPSYRYSWTGPEGFVSTAANLDGLQAGLYRLQVSTGQGNCLLEKSMLLTQPERLQISQSQVNNLCFQGNVGSISIRVTGGTAPYSYAWKGPNGFKATSENLQNLASGSYQVRVTDANGCTITGAAQTITEPSPLVLIQNKLDNSCFQGGTGNITMTASGGTAPYSYAWTGQNGFSSTLANPQNLRSGTYQVRVTDANGCTITGATQTITEPAQLALTQNKVDNVCFQGNTGSISITALGGIGPYTYAWAGPNNFSSTIANPQNLVSGSYQVTVTDANGCTIIGAAQTITEPDPLAINAQVQAESCADTKDGRIEVTPTGGKAPYQYRWDHGAAGPVATGLGAGTYRVTVTDQGGCTQTAEYVLLPVPFLRLEGTVTYQATQVPVQISVSLQSDAQGGTPPYTYRWNSGQTTPSITVTESGTYTLQLKDATGCVQEKEFAVALPLPLSIAVAIATVPLCEEQGQATTLQLSISHGLAPYQITWAMGSVKASGMQFTTRDTGLVEVEVRDALGLIEKRAITIHSRQTGPLDFAHMFESQPQFQADLVGFKGVFRPIATWPHQVLSWDFGDGTSSAEASPTHTYTRKGRYTVTLTVLDAAGCLIKVSKEVQILDYYLEIPNVFTPNGDNLNDSFFPKFRFIQNLQLQVMNKWGELIYRSQGQEGPGWDGTVAGQKAPEGVYVYKISYQAPDGRVFTSSSTFLLAR